MPRGKTQEISISGNISFYDNPWYSEEEAYAALEEALGNFRGPHNARLYTNRGDLEIQMPGSDDDYTYVIFSGYMRVQTSLHDAKDLESYANGIEPYMERALMEAGFGTVDVIATLDSVEKGIGREVDREMSWEGSFSPEAQEFMRYLKGVTIVDGDGSIDLDRPDEMIPIAIVHDGSGYTPGGVIVVGWEGQHKDEPLQAAFEILEQREFESALEDGRYDELVAEWEDPENDGYEGRAYEILTEAFDGRAWTIPADEAAEIIEKDKYASQYISID